LPHTIPCPHDSASPHFPQVNEKKIGRKDQRIGQLEKNLKEAKSKYEKLLTQCANLTAAMDLMGRTKTSMIRRNIVRPIQGGRNTESGAGRNTQTANADAANNSGGGSKD
jgi:hypothetical protein